MSIIHPERDGGADWIKHLYMDVDVDPNDPNLSEANKAGLKRRKKLNADRKSKKFHAGHRDQSAHGSWAKGRGGGGGGGDKRISDQKFDDYQKANGVDFSKGDSWSDEERTAMLAKSRELRNTWNSDVQHRLSMGDVTVAEAKERGWNGGPAGVREEQWTKLPDETYHVTTAATAVSKEGLKTRDELGGTAVLGGGATDTISLTTDLEVAKGIERGLREAAAVARGDIDVAEILDNAVSGSDASKPYIDMVIGDTNRKPGDPLPEAYEVMKRGNKVERKYDGFTDADLGPDEKRMKGTDVWKGAGGVERFRQKERPATKQEQMEDRFELYKRSSAMREYAGGPADPLFFLQDTENLAKLDPKEVRLLRIKPSKPGVGGYEVGGMKEIRVYTGEALKIDSVDPPAEFSRFSEDPPKSGRELLEAKLFHGGHRDQSSHGAWAKGRAVGGGGRDKAKVEEDPGFGKRKATEEQLAMAAQPSTAHMPTNQGVNIAEVERVIQTQEHEIFVAVARDGRVLAMQDGLRNEVALSTPQHNAVRDGIGVVYTHNHPSGRSFSDSDYLMAKQDGVGEMRAIGREGVVYSMRDIQPSATGYVRGASEIARARGPVVNKFESIGVGVTDAEVSMGSKFNSVEAITIGAHAKNSLLAAQTGATYSAHINEGSSLTKDRPRAMSKQVEAEMYIKGSDGKYHQAVKVVDRDVPFPHKDVEIYDPGEPPRNRFDESRIRFFEKGKPGVGEGVAASAPEPHVKGYHSPDNLTVAALDTATSGANGAKPRDLLTYDEKTKTTKDATKFVGEQKR